MSNDQTMQITKNIVSNNCIGARLSRLLKYDNNNPFMWSIIDPTDMLILIRDWDKIDFNKIESIEKEYNCDDYTGLNGSDRRSRIIYGVRIDGRVNVYYPHYIQDDNYEEPTKHPVRDDILVKDIKGFINDKYRIRLARMKDKPTFVISQRGGYFSVWDSKAIENIYRIKSPYKRLYHLLDNKIAVSPKINDTKEETKIEAKRILEKLIDRAKTVANAIYNFYN